MPNRVDSDRVRRRPHHHSIFFKVFAVLICAVILTYLAFGGFYRSEWNASDRIESHPSLIYYWGMLADKLGYPPDTALAARLSRNLGVAIGVKSPSFNWHSENFSEDVWENVNDSLSEKTVDISVEKGRVWGSIPKNGHTYFFGTRRRSALEGLSTDSVSLLTVIALVWFIAWMILRRMLRPLVGLETGVEAVEAGNLDVQIPEDGSDEFSRLAQSFNGMTLKLREMLKSKDQLLLDVSHELRSPLTRMRLALEIRDPDRAMARLRREINLLESMAGEVLEAERLQSPGGRLKLESTDLTALAKEQIDQISELGNEISFVSKDLPEIRIDPERIRLLLHNILENAVKYGSNPLRPIKVSLRKEDLYAVMEIQDFGIGISEKDVPFVFEPFYRTDPSRSLVKGYGLGLGLCKRIVELHGGKIFLESRIGQGTTVIIKLPLV